MSPVMPRMRHIIRTIIRAELSTGTILQWAIPVAEECTTSTHYNYGGPNGRTLQSVDLTFTFKGIPKYWLTEQDPRPPEAPALPDADVVDEAPTIVLNPDCRDGKHRSCIGAGWNETDETPADCPCDCHTKED